MFVRAMKTTQNPNVLLMCDVKNKQNDSTFLINSEFRISVCLLMDYTDTS